MEKEEIIKRVEYVLNRLTLIGEEQRQLEASLIKIFPIKVGEKVNVIKTGDDSIENVVRQAFVTRIKINYRGRDRKAQIEFDLARCKRDGKQSSLSDRIGYNEHIQKIK